MEAAMHSLNTPGLVTAHILYQFPDYPSLLQEFVWQKEDLIPEIPRLKEFLWFWQEKLEGKVHTVIVAYKGLIVPLEYNLVHQKRIPIN